MHVCSFEGPGKICCFELSLSESLGKQCMQLQALGWVGGEGLSGSAYYLIKE